MAFDAAAVEPFLDALPPRPAVVLIEPRADLAGARPLLLRTADLRRRLRLLLGPRDPDPSAAKRVHLAAYAGGIRFRLTGSVFEQSLVHYQNARSFWPHEYRKRMRMRSPALIKLSQAGAYPRAYVTRRAAAGGICLGPFASRRAAETFLESFLDVFRLRRCQIKILRDPSFPGCIYSEMKKCLAPCFAGCTDEEYAAESSRAAAFLASGGASEISALERERESASANLEFERAALLHRDLEKAEAARRNLPEIAHTHRNARRRDPAARRGRRHHRRLCREGRAHRRSLSAALYRTGQPAAFGGRNSSRGPGTIQRRRRAGNAAERRTRPGRDSKTIWRCWRAGSTHARAGEKYFFSEAGPRGWPYRRMLRACSRLLQPEAPSGKH